jgi:hypothetical protein
VVSSVGPGRRSTNPVTPTNPANRRPDNAAPKLVGRHRPDLRHVRGT